jgi:hypothetical protein
MKFRIPSISWLYKKNELLTEVKSRFKLKVTFEEPINFMVKYPTTDKHSFVKEFTLKQWEHEIELINPANVFFKIFLTSNNFLSNSKVVLEIFQIENNEIVESKQEIYKIGKNLNNGEWLKISWVKIA